MNRSTARITLVLLLLISIGCSTIKQGDGWKMLPENKTTGLTLLWELSEKKLLELLPPGQIPRIENGKGVLMLFLASTDKYSLGDKRFGSLGIAHLIIPLQNSIAIPETIGLKKQPIIKGMNQIGFPVKFGNVTLSLEETEKWVTVEGTIQFPNGSIRFSGTAPNSKGALVNLPQTTLVGKSPTDHVLSGPEFYRPIKFNSINIDQSGKNWMKQIGLTMPPDRIWVNVDFGVDFKYLKKLSVP